MYAEVVGDALQQPSATSIKELKADTYSEQRQVEVVVQAGNNTFNLNTLLPDYWGTWEAKQRLHVDPDRKRIVIPVGYFKSPGNTLSLLHEIGHAREDESKSDEEIEDGIRLRDKYTYEGVEHFTAEEKELFKNLVITSEEKAWTFALETCGKLRQIGVNLEPELKEENLQAYANSKLLSYKT